MDKDVQTIILQTFVASEILNNHEHAEWEKMDWEAMEHVAMTSLRVVVDLVKENIINTVVLREHLTNYPEQVSTLLSNTLKQEKVDLKQPTKPADEFSTKFAKAAGELWVGGILSRGVITKEEVIMDSEAWQVLHDTNKKFQHVVLGCIASRYLDLKDVDTRTLLQFMEAIMASEHNKDADLEALINEAAHSTKH